MIDTTNQNGYTPVVQTVNPNELVGHQLEGLLDANGQYIQQAVAQSQAQAAGRGLLNSNMAAGSGVNAAIQSALPIANAQAQQYAQVGAANQQSATALEQAQMAANAQRFSASTSAHASMYATDVNAQTQMAQAAQQFQEYGMGLGYQYSQLGQQGKQFDEQMQQSSTQFTQSLNQHIGEFQSQQDFAKYSMGLQMQSQGQQEYANMFGAIMMNPNMTATDRSSALTNAHDFFAQQSQFNSNIPAFVAPWTSDPTYWSRMFTHP